MPYRICKTFEVESGHMLSKHPQNCRFPHGHTRKVEIVLEAEDLDHNEMVCDYKAVKNCLEDYLQSLDHAMCMNTSDPQYSQFKQTYGDRVIGFEERDPTTEVLAESVFYVCRERLESAAADEGGQYPVRRNVRLVRVRVWETASSWAEYGE